MPPKQSRMQNNIRNNIETKINQKLSDAEFQQFSQYLKPLKIEKKDILVTEGKVCSHIYFVEKGILHSFVINTNGESHTVQFGFEGHWISDLYSFLSQKPAIFNIEALEQTEILAISNIDFEKACCEIHKFEHFSDENYAMA